MCGRFWNLVRLFLPLELREMVYLRDVSHCNGSLCHIAEVIAFLSLSKTNLFSCEMD